MYDARRHEPEQRDSYRVLFLPANPSEAETVGQELTAAGLELCVCAELSDVVTQIGEGAGAVFLVEERLQEPGLDVLLAQLQQQPTWSDLSVIVSTRNGPTSATDELERRANVTYLERPFHVRALVSNLRAALRGRRRQYETQRAIRNRDQFLAMLSHELRNPLSAMMLALHQLPPTRSRPMAILLRQTQNLRRMVDDLVEVSRVSRGRIDLQREVVDFVEVVRASTEAYRPSVRTKGLRLSVTAPSEPQWVSGDPLRLEQIVSSLLDNSVKYTPSGGRITVVVDRDAEEVRLRVQDTGMGIPPEMLDHVFELFAQAHDDVSRASGGLGIGLNLVQTLVHLHGGSVEARSSGPWQGCEVVVRLPRARTRRLPAPAPRPAPPTVRTPLRVLVVDDIEDVREMLSLMVSGFGHEVRAVSGGRAALKRVATESFDVALIDIGLPDLDGYDVARAIRTQDADMYLMAVTGYGRPEDRDRAMHAGFDLHLTKPVDVDLMRRLMDDLAVAKRTSSERPTMRGAFRRVANDPIPVPAVPDPPVPLPAERRRRRGRNFSPARRH